MKLESFKIIIAKIVLKISQGFPINRLDISEALTVLIKIMIQIKKGKLFIDAIVFHFFKYGLLI